MPTLKQKKAFKIVGENGGNISKAMKEAGYSKRPNMRTEKLTKSKGWNKLMEKYLPDKLLAEKHKELLEVPKKVRQFNKGDLMTEYEELDSNAVKSGLDMAYKLKGHYKADKIEHSGEIKTGTPIPIEALEIIEEDLKKKKTDEL